MFLGVAHVYAIATLSMITLQYLSCNNERKTDQNMLKHETEF